MNGKTLEASRFIDDCCKSLNFSRCPQLQAQGICGGILELRRGSQPSPWVGPGKPSLPLGLRGKAGGGARVTAGPKRPHLSVCPGPNFPLLGRKRSQHCILDSPGESGLVSRGSQGLRSPLESRRGSLGAP